MMMMMMSMIVMKVSDHFGTLMLFLACSGSFSGVEGADDGGCRDPVCPSGGDGRCKSAVSAAAEHGKQLMHVNISGKMASAVSSCRAPLANEEIRLYTGCGAHSERFSVEPAAGWKTGQDGTFEVSVPFASGTSLLRTELCLAPRRRCQPMTLAVPAQKKKNPSRPVGEATSISAAAGGQQAVVVGEAQDGDKAVRVNLCLGEKRRRRRLAGWDDRDMSWLRKKSTEEDGDANKNKKKKKKEQDPDGKRGWSNGIPWLKRPHPTSRRTAFEHSEKRLWEGADDEVGWIKRHSTGDDDVTKERPGDDLLPPNDQDDGRDVTAAADYADNDDDDGVPDDGPPGKRRSTAAAAAKETAPRQIPGLAAGHGGSRPEETKKYWAQSDMSWL